MNKIKLMTAIVLVVASANVMATNNGGVKTCPAGQVVTGVKYGTNGKVSGVTCTAQASGGASTSATASATATGHGGAGGAGGNASTGPVTNTNQNTAFGGEGGKATSSSEVIASGNSNVSNVGNIAKGAVDVDLEVKGSTAFGGNSASFSEGGDVKNSGNSNVKNTVNTSDVNIVDGAEIKNSGNSASSSFSGGNVLANETALSNDSNNSSVNTAVNEGNNASQSADNDVSVNVEGDTYISKQVRQAPSVAQGSFVISGCSVAGNAGGSNTHGSAFLGFGFTTRECYGFMLAQGFQAIGQSYEACEVLLTQNSTARAEKRRKKAAKKAGREYVPLTCATPAPVEVVKTVEVVKEVPVEVVKEVLVEVPVAKVGE